MADEKQKKLILEKNMSKREDEEVSLNYEASKFNLILKKMNEISTEIKEMRKENSEIKKLIKKVIEIKTSLEAKEKKCEMEKAKLEKRITDLERADKYRCKQERRNNLIIKGLEIKNNLEDKVSTLLKNSLERNVEIKSLIQLNNNKKKREA